MKAFTDASITTNYTTHSYILYSEGNEVVEQNVLKSNIKDTIQAEMSSIISLLLLCRKKNIRGLTIHTDCQSITTTDSSNKNYGHLQTLIRELLDILKAELVWIPRKLNVVADSMCREANKIIDTLKTIEFEDLIGVKKELTNPQFNIFNIEHIESYYNMNVLAHNRCRIEDVISYAYSRQFKNNKKGRLNVVKMFIEDNHATSHINNSSELLLDNKSLDELNKNEESMKNGFTSKQQHRIICYYSMSILKPHRMPVQEVLRYVSNQPNHNTKKNRDKYVQQFILENHNEDHVDLKKTPVTYEW